MLADKHITGAALQGTRGHFGSQISEWLFYYFFQNRLHRTECYKSLTIGGDSDIRKVQQFNKQMGSLHALGALQSMVQKQ